MDKEPESIREIAEALKKSLGQNTPSSSPMLYECDKCRDTGWIEIDPENRIVVKCQCRIAKEAKEKMEASGLANVMELYTFDAFKTDTPLQQKIKETAQDYLDDLFDNWDSPRKPWMYIGGNPGSGKTHICTAVCGEILKRNIGVKYMQWVIESKKLKFAGESLDDAVMDYVNPTVLYIDDLFKQKYTEHPTFTEADIRIAFTILDKRYAMNKPTIISSEWSLVDHLLEADEAVFSRVYELCKGHMLDIERDPRNNYRLSGGEA